MPALRHGRRRGRRVRAGKPLRPRDCAAARPGTVLANEEVVDGVSEVGGFPVVRGKLRARSSCRAESRRPT